MIKSVTSNSANSRTFSAQPSSQSPGTDCLHRICLTCCQSASVVGVGNISNCVLLVACSSRKPAHASSAGSASHSTEISPHCIIQQSCVQYSSYSGSSSSHHQAIAGRMILFHTLQDAHMHTPARAYITSVPFLYHKLAHLYHHAQAAVFLVRFDTRPRRW